MKSSPNMTPLLPIKGDKFVSLLNLYNRKETYYDLTNGGYLSIICPHGVCADRFPGDAMGDTKTETSHESAIDADSLKMLTLEQAFIHYRPIIDRYSRKLVRKWNSSGAMPYLDDDFLDDLIGETNLKFPNAYSRYRGESKFETYLYQIISNTLLTMTQRLRRDMGIRDSVVSYTRSDMAKMRDIGINTDSVREYTPGKGSRGVQSRVTFADDDSDHVGDMADTKSAGPGETGFDPVCLAAIEVIMGKYHRQDGELPGADIRGPVNAIILQGLTELEKPLKITIGKMYFIEAAAQKVIARQLGRTQSVISDHVNHIRRHLLDYIQRRYPETGELINKIRDLSAESGRQ